MSLRVPFLRCIRFPFYHTLKQNQLSVESRAQSRPNFSHTVLRAGTDEARGNRIILCGCKSTQLLFLISCNISSNLRTDLNFTRHGRVACLSGFMVSFPCRVNDKVFYFITRQGICSTVVVSDFHITLSYYTLQLLWHHSNMYIIYRVT